MKNCLGSLMLWSRSVYFNCLRKGTSPINKLAISSNRWKIVKRNCLRTDEFPNGRALFSRIFIFAKFESKNIRFLIFSIQWRFGHIISLHWKSIHWIYKGPNYTQFYLFNCFLKKYRLTDRCSRSVLRKINIIIIRIIIILFPCEW